MSLSGCSSTLHSEDDHATPDTSHWYDNADVAAGSDLAVASLFQRKNAKTHSSNCTRSTWIAVSRQWRRSFRIHTVHHSGRDPGRRSFYVALAGVGISCPAARSRGQYCRGADWVDRRAQHESIYGLAMDPFLEIQLSRLPLSIVRHRFWQAISC